ncbi:MAG: O-antigen ligase family protein [Phycisphaerae bacterium]|nr:O-antigen ligase family protein [Phycisphaerae bacterium]
MSATAFQSLELPDLREEWIAPDQTRSVGDRYLRFLFFCLFGYAMFGKTFAYTGIAPIFIGEFALVWGLFVLLRVPGWTRLFQVRALWPLFALFLWGIARTVPYISQYGVMALRDATVFGYGVFAIVVVALIQHRPERISRAIRRYASFIPPFLLLVTPLWAVLHRASLGLPNLPWAPDVKLISMKEADVMVHLGGVIAFWIVGFSGPVSWRWLVLMLASVGMTGLVDRSGMVAYLFAAGLATLLRPRSIIPWRLLALIVVGVVALWVTQLHYEIPGGKGREISVDQIEENLLSVTGADMGSESLDSTKEWRVDWWSDIVDYTVHGPYRWTGKGFGINLADDDGYRLDEEGTLRSPHSVHMTFLARAGVPGLLLWIGTQAAFLLGLINGFGRARREGSMVWQSLFIFLACYWGAFLLNASFDVFLEGPMGGIWFWSLYGMGIGAIWVHENCPQALDDQLKMHAELAA